jgi:hypothetical protein
MDAIAIILMALVGITCLDGCRDDEPQRELKQEGRSKGKAGPKKTGQGQVKVASYQERMVKLPIIQEEKAEQAVKNEERKEQEQEDTRREELTKSH